MSEYLMKLYFCPLLVQQIKLHFHFPLYQPVEVLGLGDQVFFAGEMPVTP